MEVVLFTQPDIVVQTGIQSLNWNHNDYSLAELVSTGGGV